MSQSLYDIQVTTINKESLSMSHFKGKTLIIVNVASKCGFTPQYKGLQELYEKYKNKNVEILGFPCNQFGGQEPGDENEIKNFCSLTYPVTFPLFAKVDVNGDTTHPLYAFLKSNAKGILGTEAVKWNFTKFLVDKNGTVVDRFAPQTEPKALEKELDKIL